MQKRGYYEFWYFEGKLKFWCLEIENKFYFGNYINEFFSVLNSLKFSITLWTWNFLKAGNFVIKPFLFFNDNKIKYVAKELLEKNEKIKYRNTWIQIAQEKKPESLSIKFYNKRSYAITFLSAKKTVGVGHIKDWAIAFNLKYHENLENESMQKEKMEDNLSIVKNAIEYHLKILNYDEKKYKTTLTSYAYWWWRKKSVVDIDSFYKNKINDIKIWNKINSSFYNFSKFYFHGYNFKNKNIKYKPNEIIRIDKKSAYLDIMLKKKLPALEIIDCLKKDCEHELSILSYEYFNFKLKKNMLPIFKNNENDFLEQGKRIVWSTIKEEHEKIFEHYDFTSKVINWKYCFDWRDYLFNDFAKKFFTLKENSIGILKKHAKVMYSTFWSYMSQKPIINTRIFEYVENNIDNNENYYKSSNPNGKWVEKIINKNYDLEKWLDVKKIKFIPLPIFICKYQLVESLEFAQLNYDKLIEVNIDEIVIKGKKENIIWPIQKDELPNWAKKLNLGKWIIKNDNN